MKLRLFLKDQSKLCFNLFDRRLLENEKETAANRQLFVQFKYVFVYGTKYDSSFSFPVLVSHCVQPGPIPRIPNGLNLKQEPGF